MRLGGTVMPALVVKGAIINTFVEGLSALGDKDTTVRIETVNGALTGNFTGHSHASLCDTTLMLDGIEKDDMESLLVGVDLSDLLLIPRLVADDDLVSIKFGDGRCSLSFGPSRRSFKLLAGEEVPPPFTSKPTLTSRWRLPKEIIKPLVETLALEGDPVLTITKNGDGDSSLRFSTVDYGGLNTAEYLVTLNGSLSSSFEGPPFKSMFDFGMFSAVRKLPTDTHIAFRCAEDYPIEMVGVKGPVTSRIMLAPRIVGT
jgi:hypothetical protein